MSKPKEADRATVVRSTQVRAKLKGDNSWFKNAKETEAEPEEEKPWLAEVRARRLNGAPIDTSPVTSPVKSTPPPVKSTPPPIATKPETERPATTGYRTRGVYTQPNKSAAAPTSNGLSPATQFTKKPSDSYKRIAPHTVRPTSENQGGQLSASEQEKRTEAASNVLKKSSARQRSYVLSAAKKFESQPPDTTVVNNTVSYVATRVEITDEDEKAPVIAAKPSPVPVASVASAPEPSPWKAVNTSVKTAVDVTVEEPVAPKPSVVTPAPVKVAPLPASDTNKDLFEDTKPGYTKVATPLPELITECIQAASSKPESEVSDISREADKLPIEDTLPSKLPKWPPPKPTPDDSDDQDDSEPSAPALQPKVPPTAESPAPVARSPLSPTKIPPTPLSPTPMSPTKISPTPLSPAPVVPAPVVPAPVVPAPVVPAPVVPAPVAPAPVARAPMSPTKMSPTPLSPTPVAPTPVARAPMSPTKIPPPPLLPPPLSPTPVAPAPVTRVPMSPTKISPTPLSPTPLSPTKIPPTPLSPTPMSPTKISPTPLSPTPVAPAPVGRAPMSPTKILPTPSSPPPVARTPLSTTTAITVNTELNPEPPYEPKYEPKHAPEWKPSPKPSSSADTLAALSDTLISFDNESSSTRNDEPALAKEEVGSKDIHTTENRGEQDDDDEESDDSTDIYKYSDQDSDSDSNSDKDSDKSDKAGCEGISDSNNDDSSSDEEVEPAVPPSPGRWSQELLSELRSETTPRKSNGTLDLLTDKVTVINSEPRSLSMQREEEKQTDETAKETQSPAETVTVTTESVIITDKNKEDNADPWSSRVRTTVTEWSSADPFDPYPIGTTSPNSSSDLLKPRSTISINRESFTEYEKPTPEIRMSGNALGSLADDIIPIDTTTTRISTRRSWARTSETSTPLQAGTDKSQEEEGQVENSQTMIKFERKSSENDSPWDRWTSPTVYSVATEEDEDERLGESHTVTTVTTIRETRSEREPVMDRYESYSRTVIQDEPRVPTPEPESKKGFVYVKEYVNATEMSSLNSRDGLDSESDYLTSSSLNYPYSSPSYSRVPLSSSCTYCGQQVGEDSKITIEHLGINCHPSCFKCGMCNKPMGDLLHSMFIHGGKVHCESCYSKV